MTSYLLPCPFCGGPARIAKTMFIAFSVSCENKQCAVRPFTNPSSHNVAVAHWNSRAPKVGGVA